jgi:hypothetical protein
MKVLAIAAAALLISTPSWAAEVTFNGLVSGIQNQTNHNLDAFQATNHNTIPASLNTQIDSVQGVINQSFTVVKANNPFGNTTVPAGFTIPGVLH